jgi:hypothetical protein
MSIQLRLRIVLAALFGALLVVSLGTALQFREIAVSVTDGWGADARVLEAVVEIRQLLDAAERGSEFERAFRAQLELLDREPATERERELVTELRRAFEQLIEHRDLGALTAADERAIEQAVARLWADAAQQATRSADTIASGATNAAIGLGILGVLGLAVGAGAFRTIRRGFLRRLGDLDRASVDIQQVDRARRVAIESDDELARIAAALNLALDRSDRSHAEMHGRNREIRALLVALLQQWSRPVAITGIDGELIASTLSVTDEQRLRSLTPQVRKAASILISRGFASAADLETDVSFAGGDILHIRALALGEQRIVGWLAEFSHATGRETLGEDSEGSPHEPDNTPTELP